MIKLNKLKYLKFLFVINLFISSASHSYAAGNCSGRACYAVGAFAYNTITLPARTIDEATHAGCRVERPDGELEFNHVGECVNGLMCIPDVVSIFVAGAVAGPFLAAAGLLGGPDREVMTDVAPVARSAISERQKVVVESPIQPNLANPSSMGQDRSLSAL